jgi:hypothetical protein
VLKASSTQRLEALQGNSSPTPSFFCAMDFMVQPESCKNNGDTEAVPKCLLIWQEKRDVRAERSWHFILKIGFVLNRAK